MPHYTHVLVVDRLQLEVNLGFYEQERIKTQKIEVSFRLYFEDAIACNNDDAAEFFDYGKLADMLREFCSGKQFNLVEFMAMELFRTLRARINELGGADARLWLKLNKVEAPVPGLLGGAAFIHSDLPPDSTFIPTVQA